MRILWAILAALILSSAASAADAKLTQNALVGSWTGTWKTPASGFTFILDFKIDAEGKITGTYHKPDDNKKGTDLGGNLTLSDSAKGILSGKITFGPKVVFEAQDNVVIAPNKTGDKPFSIKGLFITKAFPGELGKDELDVNGGIAPRK